jgi:hypothetical protein
MPEISKIPSGNQSSCGSLTMNVSSRHNMKDLSPLFDLRKQFQDLIQFLSQNSDKTRFAFPEKFSGQREN